MADDKYYYVCLFVCLLAGLRIIQHPFGHISLIARPLSLINFALPTDRTSDHWVTNPMISSLSISGENIINRMLYFIVTIRLFYWLGFTNEKKSKLYYSLQNLRRWMCWFIFWFNYTPRLMTLSTQLPQFRVREYSNAETCCVV